MKHTFHAILPAALVAAMAGGACSSGKPAVKSVQTTENSRAIDTTCRDSIIIDRNVVIDSPVISVTYLDSPSRRVEVKGHRITTRSSTQSITESKLNAHSEESSETDTTSAPQRTANSRWLWFAAGALASIAITRFIK